MYYLFLVLLFTASLSQANNGEFIEGGHKWTSAASSVVPIYLGVENYEKDLEKTFPEKPQAICTGSLVNGGKQLLSAAHCFQQLCPTKMDKNKPEYFFLLGDEKILLDEIMLSTQYCYLAYEMDYKEKLNPKPFLPELSHDVALAKVPLRKRELVKEQITKIPDIDLTPFNKVTATYHTVGFGVSDRFILENTLWLDVDKDNVHDSWDLCEGTKVKLIPNFKKLNPTEHLSTNGCSEEQSPAEGVMVLDYYTATKLSQKRGYSFDHAMNKEFIFEQYRISSLPFVVNHGYRGSFPYKGLEAMSFGGDSGAPVFIDEELTKVVAVTNLYSGIKDYALDKILNSDIRYTTEERGILMSGGFNVFLLLSERKEFLEKAMKELN